MSAWRRNEHMHSALHLRGRSLSRRGVVLAGLATGASLWHDSSFAGLAQTGTATPVPLASPEIGNTYEVPPEIDVVEGYVIPRSQPRKGGTLQLQRPGQEVKNFNPAAYALYPQIVVSYLEPLVRPHPATLQPEPWLAESWEWRAQTVWSCGFDFVMGFAGMTTRRSRLQTRSSLFWPTARTSTPLWQDSLGL